VLDPGLSQAGTGCYCPNMGQNKRFSEVTVDEASAAWSHVRQADLARTLVLRDVVHVLTSRGWTVRQVADHLGVSKSQVNRIARDRLPLAIPTGASGDQALDFADRAWAHAGGRPTGVPWGDTAAHSPS
jgi:predicted XRE-type DNA-binding protein